MDSESVSYLKNSYEGCGHSKAEALLHTFGSIENIEKAKLEELTEVDNVGEVLAKRIVDGETKVPHHFDYPYPDELNIQSLRRELSDLMENGSDEQIISLFEEVVNQTCPEGKKQAQIGVLVHVFGRVPDSRLIAEAASDADPIYVRRFVWDDQEGRVVLKRNAAKRRIEQVDMVRRKQILEAYGSCVGCGRFSNCKHQMKIHHITPVDSDGSGEDTNVVPVCPNCHSDLHRTGRHGESVFDTQEEFWEWAELEPQSF